MNFVGKMHGCLVFGRRVSILAAHLAKLLPEGARVLDVGCGDGLVDKLIMELRPDVSIVGIDVLVRGNTHIPVMPFDGITIPYDDDAFDAIMFVDVLHHTIDPTILLREAKRACSKCLVIKDHTRDGLLAEVTLRFMDWVGNAHHGVVLPYNYWSKKEWDRQIELLELRYEVCNSTLELYPWPASILFDRQLHFVVRLMKTL